MYAAGFRMPKWKSWINCTCYSGAVIGSHFCVHEEDQIILGIREPTVRQSAQGLTGEAEMSRDGFGVLHATALDKRTLVRCRARVVASFAVLLAASLLPARAAAERMKLLTRDTGWVADTHSLYWTSDGGPTGQTSRQSCPPSAPKG